MAGEPSFLRRSPNLGRFELSRLGEAIKKRLFSLLGGFFLGDFFLRNFLLGFLYRFLLSCFLFCHGLDHLLSSVFNCEKELGFSDNYTDVSSNFARSLEAFYGSMCGKRRSTAIDRREKMRSAIAAKPNGTEFRWTRRNMRLTPLYAEDWTIAIPRRPLSRRVFNARENRPGFGIGNGFDNRI